MASSTDKFKKARRKFATTVGAGGISLNGTTLPLASSSGMDTDTAVIVVVDSRDANGVATPDLEEVIVGVVSGDSLITCLRGLETTTQQPHSEGALVAMYFTESHWDSLLDGILTEHNQNGTHGNITTGTITSGDITADGITANDLTVGGLTIQQLSGPAGGMMFYGGAAAPTGWLLCDGSAVSRATYSALFTAISTTYGVGNGTTTFNVPNLKGKTPFGLDAGVTAFNTLAKTGGAQTVDLTHNHGTDVQGVHSHSIQTNSGVYRGGQASTVLTTGTSYSPPGHDHDGVAFNSGGHTHNVSSSLGSTTVLNPYLVGNFIIKT